MIDQALQDFFFKKHGVKVYAAPAGTGYIKIRDILEQLVQ